jgi:hypothetical protein
MKSPKECAKDTRSDAPWQYQDLYAQEIGENNQV